MTGNGRQGALCWGTPAAVRLTVSHERLFLPLRAPLPAPETATILPRLRDLLDQGHYAQAAAEVCERAAADEPAYRETVWIDPLVGAATLTVRPHRPGGELRRSVDLATGVVELSWPDELGESRVEIFASRPADAVVVRLSATGGFSGTLELQLIDGTPPRPVTARTRADAGGLTLHAEFDAAWPGALTGYRVHCQTLTATRDNPTQTRDARQAGDATPAEHATPTRDARQAGDARRAGGTLEVRSDATLIIRTLLPGDPEPAPGGDFDTLLAEHQAVHGELLDRVHLDLAAEPAERAAPTAALLARPVGPALVERLFDAGRYAIISSTGDLPPTLQGVWSGTWTPPWSSGYTLDGNLPAAVAGTLPTATPELLLPVFDLLDAHRDDLRHNARRLYGARGLLTPVHLSTHGRQNHFGPVWCQTFWTAGAAWMSRLYVDYWRYTGDRAFLHQRALPFLREAADFYLDFVQVRDGTAVFSPSYSPENAPASTGSQACVDATMDVAVVRDLLTNLLRFAAGEPAAPRWRALLDALPAYRVAGGLLAEWCREGLDDQPAHRHASHLWPLWYEPDPLITGDPALHAAAVATVRSRLAWWAGADSDEMAYGLVQLGLAAAALGLAEEAYGTVATMAGRYWGTNLVPTHNRDAMFNVDIAGGLPAVVAAMLVRSAHGRLDLLPAVPAAWPRGRVTGLAARDAIRVLDLRWEPGEVTAVLCALRETRVVVGAPVGTPVTVTLPAGRTVPFRFSP